MSHPVSLVMEMTAQFVIVGFFYVKSSCWFHCRSVANKGVSRSTQTEDEEMSFFSVVSGYSSETLDACDCDSRSIETFSYILSNVSSLSIATDDGLCSIMSGAMPRDGLRVRTYRHGLVIIGCPGDWDWDESGKGIISSISSSASVSTGPTTEPYAPSTMTVLHTERRDEKEEDSIIDNFYSPDSSSIETWLGRKVSDQVSANCNTKVNVHWATSSKAKVPSTPNRDSPMAQFLRNHSPWRAMPPATQVAIIIESPTPQTSQTQLPLTGSEDVEQYEQEFSSELHWR